MFCSTTVCQRGQSNPPSAAYLRKAHFVMCWVTDWTEGTLQTRQGRNYDLSAAVQDVAPEMKTLKFPKGTAPKQGPSGPGARQRWKVTRHVEFK